MSSITNKLMSLSAALAAITGTSAVLPTSVDAATPNSQTSPDAGRPAQSVKIGVGEELMSFTVTQGANGMIVADHESHASHASHSSHSSHYSSR